MHILQHSFQGGCDVLMQTCRMSEGLFCHYRPVTTSRPASSLFFPTT